MATRFKARRFAEPSQRPDCFEVFDSTTGDAASPGLFKYQALEAARAMNKRFRGLPQAPPLVYEHANQAGEALWPTLKALLWQASR